MVWRFHNKLKIKFPHDPIIPLPGIYPQKTKTLIQKDICTPMFIVTLFAIVKFWEQPKCPSIDEWIKRVWYTYDGMLLSL